MACRAREAFWAYDRRKANAERSLKGIGLGLEHMAYAFIVTCMADPFVVFTGFELPYVHHADKSKCKVLDFFFFKYIRQKFWKMF